MQTYCNSTYDELYVACQYQFMRKDVIKLEKVQHRATKLIPALRNKSYEDRLTDLNLFSLEKRRIRGDMIEVWKIISGHENLDRSYFFELQENSITRNNGCKIVGRRFQTEIARNWFTYRVVDEWNRLPNLVVNSETLSTFKKRIDEYYRNRRYNFHLMSLDDSEHLTSCS